MLKKLLLTLPALMVLVWAGGASAATLTKSECEAQGGTYSNDRGTKACALPVTETDPSGNSGNAWVVEGQSEESQHGSIGAPGTSGTFEESTITTDCTNPGGNAMKLSNPHCEL